MRMLRTTLLGGSVAFSLAIQVLAAPTASASEYGAELGTSVGACWTRYTAQRDFAHAPELLVGVTLGATSCAPLGVTETTLHAAGDPGVSTPDAPIKGATGIAGAVSGNWSREKQDLGPFGAVLLSPLWVMQSFATPVH